MKPKFYIPFIVFFLIILSMEIYGEHIFATTKDFSFLLILQPALLPLLIVYLIFNFRKKFTTMAKWTLAGLCLDWIADIFLTGYKDQFNLPSMFGYFAGHICYGFAFVMSSRESGYKVSLMNRFIFSLPPVFYVLVYYLFIFNYISSHQVDSYFLVPLTVYVFSIIFMSTTALWRMGTTNESSYWCIASGALFYMLSDSITGYDHFVKPVYMRYVASMFTYGVAVLLFTFGAILHQPAMKKV